MPVQKVLDALKAGKTMALYDADDREGEADLIFHAKFATPEKIEQLRKDAGGLICLAVAGEIAEELELEFFTDILEKADSKLKAIGCKKTAYGDKPAFSIPINHNDVYTGITDNDRALTLRKFAEVVEDKNMKNEFSCSFYTPGHVFLLIGRGIKKRKGHTELSLELAKMAGLSGAMVLCEMLGSGKALPKAKVIEYCKKQNIEFLEGSELYED